MIEQTFNLWETSFVFLREKSFAFRAGKESCKHACAWYTVLYKHFEFAARSHRTRRRKENGCELPANFWEDSA